MCAVQHPHTGGTAGGRDDAVQRIKESIQIVDLIAPYTNLVPAGKRMKGLSPFTNEKTPSFYVDPEEGVYYCFSSQKGGDIFSFVQEVEGVDFKGALTLLAEQAGVELGSHQSRKRRDTTTNLYDLLASAATVYQELLTDEVRSYLTGRGITEASIAVWGVGFAPNAWRTLTGNRTKQELEQYRKAGLCVQKGDRWFDFFRGRIQFPFHDSKGRVIGFSGRAYGETETAKYINSPETMDPPLFNKSTFLYGLHRAKQEIRRQGVAVLTEGPIDAILMHQIGYPIAVATSGTAVTAEHLKELQRLSGGRLILALDSDDAGRRATLRVIDMAISLGIDATDMKVISLPEGKDPADTIATDPEVFRQKFRDAQPVVVFLTEYINQQVTSGGTTDRVRGVLTHMVPIIAKVQNPVTRDHLQKEAAAFCSVTDTSIAEMVDQLRDGSEETAPVRRVSVGVNRQPDRVAALLHSVASAQAFLGTKEDALEQEHRDALRVVQNTWDLPSISCEEAVIRYEEGMADLSEQERLEQVQETLRESLNTLRQEARKRQEVAKSRSLAV